MEILDTPETLDGVLESDDTLVIAASHDSDDTLVGVEMGAITSATGPGGLRIEIDDVVGVSGIVDNLSTDEATEPLGRKNDVSNEVSTPSASANEPTDGEARRIDDSYDRLVSAAQSEGCTDGLGGGGGDDGAGEGVMSTSDSVMLVTVVTGGAVVVGISVETELGTTNDTVDELRVTDDTGVGVNDVEPSSKEEGGRDMRAGSIGGIKPRSKSEMLGIVAGEGGMNSSTTEDATDSGSGTSSGCIEQISAVVYPVEGSLGQMSAVSYSEPISAVPYSDSDGIVGSDSYVVDGVLAVR